MSIKNISCPDVKMRFKISWIFGFIEKVEHLASYLKETMGWKYQLERFQYFYLLNPHSPKVTQLMVVSTYIHIYTQFGMITKPLTSLTIPRPYIFHQPNLIMLILYRIIFLRLYYALSNFIHFFLFETISIRFLFC